MPDTEIERAYRDGTVDAKLAAHETHLAAINGTQERTKAILEQLGRSVDKLGDQMTGLLLTMPKLQEVADRVLKAEEVALALRQKHLDDQSFWERNRLLVAWGLGVLAVLTTSANFWLRLFGVT